MDKNEILKILETAKDKDGEIPMRLVRQAFEELPEPCDDVVSRKAVEHMLQNGLPARGMWEIEGDVVKQTVCETLADALMDLEKLPSAQSTMGQQNDGDTISRRMAIDAMANTLWHYPNECYRNLNEYEFAKGLAELGLKSVPAVQSAEAIPVAFLEEQAKWFESMDNAFAKIEANNIRVMIKKWRSKKDERSD